MAGSLKPLYRSNSLRNLKRQAQCRNLEKVSVEAILSAANEFFAKAEKSDLTGDEERAFCYYFRYADAISLAHKKEDFSEAVAEEKLLKRKVIKAINKVDVLGTSLAKRYALLKDIKSKSKVKEDEDVAVAKARGKRNKEKKNGIGGDNLTGVIIDESKSTVKEMEDKDAVPKRSGSKGRKKSRKHEKRIGGNHPGVANGGITPNELKLLMDEKVKNILFVDCRDKADFTKSHVNHPNCIWVPPTSLLSGMSASMIQCVLKDKSRESYMHWRNRASFDCIILYDWNSSFGNHLQPLDIVYNALVKYDQATLKKTKTGVLVVEGGLKSICSVMNAYYVLLN